MSSQKMTAKGEKTKARTRVAASERSSTGSAGGAALFVALRKIWKTHEASLKVTRDDVGGYELTTRAGVFAGGARTARAHTSFFLGPLASEPELVESMSVHLRIRFDGKLAFHFKTVEPVLFEELTKLTEKALERWRAAGKL